MDHAEAIRLTWALSVSGLLLLAMEVWLPGGAMLIIGSMALLAAVGISGYGLGFHIGAVLLSGLMTLVSIGFLVVLVYLPKSPLAHRVLRRAAQKAEENPFDHLKGAVGEAITDISPTGTARFANEELEVQTKGESIEPNARIAVIRVTGRTVTVRKR